jgi:DNA-binding NtrC family response regulator
MITGHGSVEKAVEAMKLGAYDFIEKPFDINGLLKVVAKALEKQRLSEENHRLRVQLQQQRGVEALIGDSPAMLAVKNFIRQIADAHVSVLIQGESGVGKEIVADIIQRMSDRQDKPFVKISCAAIPESLLESELFGHERGAFTGALTAHPGKFECAHGGTLLLDEIAEMSPSLQAKLLRVLQDGRFQRLGGTRELQADFRLISATNCDIPQAIKENKFRLDLYYRINTFQIMLPPLRDRREDIPLLAGYFLGRLAAQMHKDVRSIAPAAMEQLRAHGWPGNVRELEHVIQRGVVLATGSVIQEFSFAPMSDQASKPAVPVATGPAVTIPIGTTFEEGARQLVEATIHHCGGNKLKAAQLLCIPPRTMYRRYS